jgi:hypothetical protein
MKKTVLSLVVAGAASWFLTGCTNVFYTKTVVTTLDSKGAVVSTVITESITEPHHELPRLSVPGTVDMKRVQQ